MNKRFKKYSGTDFQMWFWNVRGLGDYILVDCKVRNVFFFFSDYTEWDVVMF